MTKRMTKECFVLRARSIHGDKFDYTNSVFTTQKEPITIYCNIHHREFTVPRAQAHIQGSCQECPDCLADRLKKRSEEYRAAHPIEKRKSYYTKIDPEVKKQNILNNIIRRQKAAQERFIKNTKELYGNKYDISETLYKGLDTEITVRCPNHGYFNITPRTFLSGHRKHGHYQKPHGCWQCEGLRVPSTRPTVEQVMAEVKEKYRGIYDFSAIHPKNLSEKFSLRCPKHEVFETSLGAIRKRNTCPYCNGRLWFPDVIAKAKAVHGDKYSYEECAITRVKGVKYLSNIRCPEHGLFDQRVDVHIKQGCGCWKCSNHANELSAEERKQNYIDKIVKKFGAEKFDFSKVHYIDKRHKVWIKCNEHNEWFYANIEDLARSNKAGGCKYCTRSTGEIAVNKWLKDNSIGFLEQYCIPNIHPEKLKLLYLMIDFYIPQYRLFIEFNGMQHYKDIRMFHAMRNDGRIRTFETQQLRDQTMREYCVLNNINLLEIRYDEIDEVGRLIADKIKEISNNKDE